MVEKSEIFHENKLSNANSIDHPIQDKIQASLITHVYKQGTIGLGGSLLSATIILIGLYSIPERSLLFGWYSAVVLVSLMRYIAIEIYLKHSKNRTNLSFWSNLFSLGSLANGLCWGFLASILLPYENLGQLSLTLFIIAGMTSGAVPLLSGIQSAIFYFLAAVLIPLMIKFLLLPHSHFKLFSVALLIYYAYLNLLARKNHAMIKNSIALQYENDALVENLSTAKQELELSNMKLEHAAKHDPLTNLSNRSLFEVSLASAIARAHQENKLLALLYLDIDNFKEVNDAYGHHVGDQLLQRIVERLKRKLPDNVIASRLGGDELTFILEDITEPENVAELCRVICATIAKPFEIIDFNLSVTASVGVSIYPIDGGDTEMLVKNADKAMYYVKDRGGNNFHFNTEFSTLKSAVSNAFFKKASINLRDI